MQRFATLLFLTGLLFLLSVLTGILSFGAPPMLIGQAIQQTAIEDTGSANIVAAVLLGYRGIDTLGELSILFAAATAGGLVLVNRGDQQHCDEADASATSWRRALG